MPGLGIWDLGILGLEIRNVRVSGFRFFGISGFWGFGILGFWDFGTLGFGGSGSGNRKFNDVGIWGF